MSEKFNLINLLKNITRLFFFCFILIISAGSVFLTLFNLSFSDKIYPGISVSGKSIGNKTPKIAQQLIENRISLWQNKKNKINYKNPDELSFLKQWEVSPAEMGFSPSAAKTALAAYNYGRIGNPIITTKQKIKLILYGENQPLAYDFSEQKFNDFFSANLSFLEKSGKNASLSIFNGQVIATPAQNGYGVDQIALLKKISFATQYLTEEKPISLEIIPTSPDITDEKTWEAKKQAENLLAKKISLRFENNVWVLASEIVNPSLAFEPKKNDPNKNILSLKINSNLIFDYLEKIQLEINREPSNAIFGEKNGDIFIESGGETGLTLNLNSNAQKISEAILNDSKNDKKDLEIELVVEQKEPLISKKFLENLKISSLIGQGKSNFAGSPKNRRYNIAVGSAKFNNIIIYPNQDFSFVETLGEVTSKAGYLPELVIKGNRTVPELGGGLCQVSTTAFRAAIYAGLPILERKPHAYPVIYYNPQGMDATIYPPHPDLKFKNDTGGPIFVQTKIEKNELFFNFFGIKQSRTIKIIGPNIYEKKSDGSLKAVFWREFYSGDNLLTKESFYSSYSSPAKYPHKNPLE